MAKQVQVHNLNIDLPALTVVDLSLLERVETIPLLPKNEGKTAHPTGDRVSLIRFHFKKTEQPPIAFLAGQHFNIMIKNFLNLRGEKEKIGRSLSFASSPLSLAQHGYFDTMVLYEAGNVDHDEPPGALTTHLFHPDFKKDHLIKLSGPIGGDDGFFFTEAIGRKIMAEKESLCFIGGNVGVGPLLSMVLLIKQLGLNIPILFIESSKIGEDILITETLLHFLELKGLPNLKVFHTVTRDPNFPGLKGRINVENLLPTILKQTGFDLKRTTFYACGGGPFADSIEKYLTGQGEVTEAFIRGDEVKQVHYPGLGIPKERVFVEGFTSTQKLHADEIKKKLHGFRERLKTRSSDPSLRAEIEKTLPELKGQAEKLGAWKENSTHLVQEIEALSRDLNGS